MNEEEIKKGGWTQASISGGAHLERMVEMYKEMGFEVYLKELKPEECGQCTTCFEAAGETIYRVYTRPKGEET